MLGHFSYLFYMCVFAVTPLFYIWLKYHSVLWRYRNVIKRVLIIGIVYAIIADSIAIKILGIWGFNENKILNFWLFGMPIDDFIFAVVISIIVSSATLLFCIREEKRER